jgi:protein-S-isoprenylcysteine O-methyltransferase Ste14
LDCGRTWQDHGMRTAAAVAGSSLFFAVAPGVVAGVVPWALTRWQGAEPPWPLAVRLAGGVLLGGGAVVLVQAFARFVREGRGTPAPVGPTERLVVGGLYRHVRNPMYVAVVTTIVGQALLLGRPVLLVYAAVAGTAMAAFVRGYEEPRLSDRYGEQYRAYRRAVPGWVPRMRPWSPHADG